MALHPVRAPIVPVNPQVVDGVTLSAAHVVGEAPAMSLGVLYQAAAQSAARLLHNIGSSQGALQQLNVAVVATSVAKMVAAKSPPPTSSSSGGDPSGSGGSSSTPA